MAKCQNAKKKSKRQRKNGAKVQKPNPRDFAANISNAPKVMGPRSGIRSRNKGSQDSNTAIVTASLLEGVDTPLFSVKGGRLERIREAPFRSEKKEIQNRAIVLYLRAFL